MTKEPIFKEDIKILNVYWPNHGASKYVNQNLVNMQKK